MQLRNWIDFHKLHQDYLASNENAIHLFEGDTWVDNPLPINWGLLSSNPNPRAIQLIEEHLEGCRQLNIESEVNWKLLSKNPSAIHILDKEIKDSKEQGRECKVEGWELSMNPSSNIVSVLEKNIYGLHWGYLARNPSAYSFYKENLEQSMKNGYSETSYWKNLSRNPNPDAICLIEKELGSAKSKVCWYGLCSNPATIHLVEREFQTGDTLFNKIHWMHLSRNPSAIHIIERELQENGVKSKLDWQSLSENPSAIHLLEKNIDKIDWKYFSQNPSIFE